MLVNDNWRIGKAIDDCVHPVLVLFMLVNDKSRMGKIIDDCIHPGIDRDVSVREETRKFGDAGSREPEKLWAHLKNLGSYGIPGRIGGTVVVGSAVLDEMVEEFVPWWRSFAIPGCYPASGGHARI